MVCQVCHYTPALDLAGGPDAITNVADSMGNADSIRLRQAWRIGDPVAKPIVPINTRFAENSIPASFRGCGSWQTSLLITNSGLKGPCSPARPVVLRAGASRTDPIALVCAERLQNPPFAAMPVIFPGYAFQSEYCVFG